MPNQLTPEEIERIENEAEWHYARNHNTLEQCYKQVAVNYCLKAKALLEALEIISKERLQQPVLEGFQKCRRIATEAINNYKNSK